MDSELVKYILDNPLESIGVIILALGCLEIGRLFSGWVEKTIKDDFFAKPTIYLGIFLIMLLFFALAHQMVD